MSDAILIPGDVPGLLSKGAPIVLREDVFHEWGSFAAGDIGVVHRVGEEAIEVAVWNAEHGSAILDVPDSALALDLRDEAGVDRALRWLAERVGMTSSLSSPAWNRYHVDRASPGGRLSARPTEHTVTLWEVLHSNGRDGRQCLAELPAGWAAGRRVCVPALASIPSTAPMRICSRWSQSACMWRGGPR